MRKQQAKNRVSLLLCILTSTFFMQAVGAKDIYGFMTGNANPGTMPIGIYKFDTTDGNSLKLQQALMFQLWGGAYAENHYYMMLSDDAAGYMSEGLCRYDLKTKETQMGYAYQEYQCSDMTYDYSTETMYGIMVRNGGEPIQHQLVKIDLKNGERAVVAKLKDKIAAIACNYFGDIYVMSTESKLYSMDSQTGEMTFIGDTDVRTNSEEAQSMEFDRETGELYWTGLDSSDLTFLKKIDPYTGKITETVSLSNNALIAALHIPFKVASDEAPAKAENLSIRTTDNEVTLKWTNPSKTYGGNDLPGGITKIEILCNGNVIETINDALPGTEQEWTDRIQDCENGKKRYVIYAYNDAGRGEPASCLAIVGEDVPDKVSRLAAENDGANVRLTWKAPSKGKNGGTLKAENIRYEVTRFPDGKTFGNIIETEFTDNTLTAPAYCSYQVVCYNEQGRSDASVTDTLSAGGSIIPPYHADFTDPKYGAQWKIIDANNDNNTWTYSIDSGKFTCYTFFDKSNDSLVSVPFTLKKGMKYTVKYKINAADMFGTSEHFLLTLKGKEHEKTLEELTSFNTQGEETRSVDLTTDADGEYKFVMTALSEPNQWCIEISGFSVDVLTTRDLAVTAIEGSETLTQNTMETYKISIKNNGKDLTEGFRVIMTDQHGKKLAQAEDHSMIAAGQTKTVEIGWTPSSTDITSVTATVETTGDEISTNNSITKNVTVIPADEKYIEMGGKESTPTIIPFGFEGYLYSYSQTIYRAEDTGGKAGEIKELIYDYVNNGNALKNKHIRIYMSNTESGSVNSGWLSETEMSLVFDGEMTFSQGRGTMRIILDKPFLYTGGNLCVMCQKLKDAEIGNISFFAKNFEKEARAAIYNSDNQDIDLTEVKGSSMLCNVKMRIKENKTDNIPTESITDNRIFIRNGKIEIVGHPANISIFDTSGKVVTKATNTSSLDISQLRSGIYILKAKAEKISLVRKFVIE